ncbi:Iron-sulfur assembly protein 1 [Thecaphora frezii]
MAHPMLPFLYPRALSSGWRQATALVAIATTNPAPRTACRCASHSHARARLFSSSSRSYVPSSTSKAASAAQPSSYANTAASSSSTFPFYPSSQQQQQQQQHVEPAKPSPTPQSSVPQAPSGAQPASTSSVDAAACATLSPSSPSAPRSQKAAPQLTPTDATELSKKPEVAASMPEATQLQQDKGQAAPAAPALKKTTSDRGTRFRAQKAALKLTPAAVLRLRSLLESDQGPKLIRVGVRNKGCAGMSYHLEYITPDQAGKFDERVKQDGVEVLIDSKALFSIIGSEMDWQEDRLSAKFVFNNPNVKEACGCGESFLT